MNKRIIQLIIGVLSVAVIGLVALQTDLILTSIRASEEAFDKNVQNAMSIVAERVKVAAEAEDVLKVINGYSAQYFDIDGINDPENENGGMSIPVGDANGYENKIFEQLQIKNVGLCEKCGHKATQKIPTLDKITYNYVNIHRPIEERIEAHKLSMFLAQALENNAIKINYEFGVFSNDRDAFVIHNGQYTSSDIIGANSGANAFPNLKSTPYKVSLFEGEESETTGSLKLFFPEKSATIWRTLLPSFIGTFLFAAIILGCFGYTVWVIFRQKHLSEMKSDFINNMTHEFKTPIATISLAADSIINPRVYQDISKLTRFTNIIKQENKRMNSQVEKVLQMARIDREDSKLRLAEVNLHEVIDQAIENIGLQVEKRQGSAKAILEATQPIVKGDLTHISNVINNLLDNANKYSPDTPSITIRTKNLSKGVQVTVSDKGMGLSKEARKHIFDKFYRVHTGDRHDIKGFGLGLSYVKAIMATHNGSVEVKSELEKGSDFILFFPFEQVES